jgi:hypothetical protein
VEPIRGDKPDQRKPLRSIIRTQISPLILEKPPDKPF